MRRNQTAPRNNPKENNGSRAAKYLQARVIHSAGAFVADGLGIYGGASESCTALCMYLYLQAGVLLCFCSNL